jgi:hypothetical protein
MLPVIVLMESRVRVNAAIAALATFFLSGISLLANGWAAFSYAAAMWNVVLGGRGRACLGERSQAMDLDRGQRMPHWKRRHSMGRWRLRPHHLRRRSGELHAGRLHAADRHRNGSHIAAEGSRAQLRRKATRSRGQIDPNPWRIEGPDDRRVTTRWLECLQRLCRSRSPARPQGWREFPWSGMSYGRAACFTSPRRGQVGSR